MKNITKVGARVTLFHKNGKKYKALIFAIDRTKVDIAVYPSLKLSRFKASFKVIEAVRHADFKKDGEHYWDFKKS